MSQTIASIAFVVLAAGQVGGVALIGLGSGGRRLPRWVPRAHGATNVVAVIALLTGLLLAGAVSTQAAMVGVAFLVAAVTVAALGFALVGASGNNRTIVVVTHATLGAAGLLALAPTVL